MRETDRIEEAFQYLRRLIGSGWEFPDAAAKAAERHDVKVDDIRRRYDHEWE
jgi:hypothetical protein